MQLIKWKQWQILRKNGKTFYIFISGGITGGIMLSGVALIIFQILFPIHEWLLRILFVFPINYILGVMVSLLVWNKNEIHFLSEEPPKPTRIKKRG